MWTIEHYDNGESLIPEWTTTIEDIYVVWNGKFNFEFCFGEEGMAEMEDWDVSSVVDAYVSAKRFIEEEILSETGLYYGEAA
tara:strand:- start:420 stop:665 length:246 start_codon:yes stop_codon:yes gene_type:complete